MKNPLDRRLLWVSLGFHLVALVFISFINRDSSLRKKFLAFRRHSKKLTHAYFRPLRAPTGGYQKYFKSRNIKKKTVKKRPKPKVKAKPKVKKLVKKSPVKPKPKKAVKKKIEKKPVKKEIKKEIKKKEIEKEVEEKNEQEEVLHFNLMGETDPRVIMYQQCIQVEVDRVWRPPLGVPKGTECEVYFSVARDGSIKEFKIQKPSSMLIYDLSIVRVSKQFKFDRCLWGKSFMVAFRQ